MFKSNRYFNRIVSFIAQMIVVLLLKTYRFILMVAFVLHLASSYLWPFSNANFCPFMFENYYQIINSISRVIS